MKRLIKFAHVLYPLVPHISIVAKKISICVKFMY